MCLDMFGKSKRTTANMIVLNSPLEWRQKPFHISGSVACIYKLETCVAQLDELVELQRERERLVKGVVVIVVFCNAQRHQQHHLDVEYDGSVREPSFTHIVHILPCMLYLCTCVFACLCMCQLLAIFR